MKNGFSCVGSACFRINCIKFINSLRDTTGIAETKFKKMSEEKVRKVIFNTNSIFKTQSSTVSYNKQGNTVLKVL